MFLDDVLKRCRELTLASQDAVWSSESIAEIVAALDRAIAAIEREEDPDFAGLRLMFAPTGNLQETAIANGWADEYLSLSARFDNLMG